MSEEIVFEDPEIILSASLTHYKGRPQLKFFKKIEHPGKIKILADLILQDKYVPAKITVKDKLLFKASLKKYGLI